MSSLGAPSPVKQEPDTKGGDENSLATPDIVPSHDPQIVGHDSASPQHKSTTVDGQGMWRSWARVFSKPESACFDLLDNCFDAVLRQNGEHAAAAANNEHHQQGKRKERVELMALGDTALSIQNSSIRPIKPLETALTVYKSSKNSNSQEQNQQNATIHEKDSIGENGVGLKQGAAALSDCSLVFTKNKNVLEIGIIAKALQSSSGVYLPSFTFVLYNPQEELHEVIDKWLAKNPSIEGALEQSFVDMETLVVDQVVQLADRLWKGDWEDEPHVFLLVLCNLKTGIGTSNQKNDHIMAHDLMKVSPAGAFLNFLKTVLPKHYINLPLGQLDFLIGGERLEFAHWQRRLVEMAHFTVPIATRKALETMDEETWDQVTDDKYLLNIYCGFDAVRLNQNVESNGGPAPCQLLIYSCRAGRLIQTEVDARHLLSLGSSGVDFTQGLTVIIYDETGQLPLTPTKDAIAWSEQAYGDVHRSNLFTWAGAVAHYYWRYTYSRFGKVGRVKEIMRTTIQNFASEADGAGRVTESLKDAQFTTFQGLVWKRRQAAVTKRWLIRNVAKNLTLSQGSDTLLPLTQERIRARGKKRHIILDGPKAATSTNSDGATVNTEGDEAGEGSSNEPRSLRRAVRDVLAFLRDLDEGKLFELPVVVQAPNIKEEYLKSISRPMDFHTIENERLETYQNVNEFYADLVLIFENCIDFNGEDSIFGEIAQDILERLNESFESLVFGQRIRKRPRKYKYPDSDEETTVARKKPATTNKKVKPLQAQLKETKVELQKTKSELRGTKEELNATKAKLEEARSVIALLTRGGDTAALDAESSGGNQGSGKHVIDDGDHVFHC
mmetsp:Transcript_24625/g.56444  ORF Transcript_24625/g.56444 Transcript_24625/m.56444 type:complete len:838 (+) Transcript_24625:149-2662(+)